MTDFVFIRISNTIDKYDRTDKKQPMKYICNVFNKVVLAIVQDIDHILESVLKHNIHLLLCFIYGYYISADKKRSL